MQNLDLFLDTSRWPRKPYCSDDKTAGKIRSLEHALKQPYIQANPPHLRVWSIFDVDRAGGALAWEDAALPPPTWSACNTENGHAHLVWGLSVPVLVDSPDMRQLPLRYLCAVEAAFRAKLDADSGYTGLITKNPAFPDWRILRGPRASFELGELAEYVDLTKFAPKRKPEQVGLGRNVTLFDDLRHYAYRHVKGYKQATRCAYFEWQKDIDDKAMTRNGDFPKPLDVREVRHIAKSREDLHLLECAHAGRTTKPATDFGAGFFMGDLIELSACQRRLRFTQNAAQNLNFALIGCGALKDSA